MSEEFRIGCDSGCGESAEFECHKCGGNLCNKCFQEAHPKGVCIHY